MRGIFNKNNKNSVKRGEPSDLLPNYGMPDCQCFMCQSIRAKGMDVALINHGTRMDAVQIDEHGFTLGNRVTLPRDSDYSGCLPGATPCIA